MYSLAASALRVHVPVDTALKLIWIVVDFKCCTCTYLSLPSLQLCEQLLSTDLSTEERYRLRSFVRTLCVGGAKGGRGWERLLKSAVKELASHKVNN